MKRYLVQTHSPADNEASTRFGGRPLVDSSVLGWPICRSCQGPMQFLGQVVLGGDRMLSLFMCQNDPGMCDEWEADAGANAAYLVDTSSRLSLMWPQRNGVYELRGRWGAELMAQEAADQAAERGRPVLGALGGKPAWIQADETPDCDACTTRMEFVLQFDEGPDHRTAMNFGDRGMAYAFRCGCGAAKMLFQC